MKIMNKIKKIKIKIKNKIIIKLKFIKILIKIIFKNNSCLHLLLQIWITEIQIENC